MPHFLLALLTSVPALAAEPSPKSAAFFEQKVLPVLRDHCFPCHSGVSGITKGGLRLDVPGGLTRGGDSGPAVVPGQPRDSLLLKAVRRDTDAAAMPPKGVLSATAIADLERWVAAGAVDPRSVVTAPEHWSLRPVRRPDPPAVQRTTWPRNAIDHFILARLEAAGLAPSPEADRHTLLRRVTFDLTGLPPTPAEMDAFTADSSPDAYEQVVDRLLASPAYGERWARHWLDAVRFAESHGFETNLPRPSAWRYRDWVIQAFNTDLPYDQFVRAQVAGDATGADEATGFLVAGAWDAVKSPDPVLTAQQRADELHDMVSVTGSTFLGMTVGCARCHTHKFDPVSHRDYHAIKAVFAGVRHGDRPLPNAPDAVARQQLATQLRRDLDRIDATIAAREPIADPTSTATRRAAVRPTRNIERFTPVTAKSVRFTAMATSGLEPCLDELEVFTSGPTPRNAARDTGVVRASSGDYPGGSIHKLEHINDGQYGNGRSWISNQVGKGWVELTFPTAVTIDRIAWARDREGKYTDRLATVYRIEATRADGTRTLLASSDDRAAPGQATPTVGLYRRMLEARRVTIEKQLRTTAALPMAYAGTFTTPDPVYRLHRGDPTQPREPVPPGALASVGPKLTLPESATDQERRVALAGWLTDLANPLPARVMANRLWHYHFGTGLVDTPSDLGRNGGKPTHPELLDWLASELTHPTAPPNGRPWSMKRFHRLLVTSATYRQASRGTAAGLQADADTRLLWRYPPRRLEAEAIRDTILAVSGQLDRTAGGPGFDLFEPNTNYVKVYTPRREFPPETFRRMVYWSKPRMQPDDTFGAFDCPDAGQIAPARNTSTTPLQALNLLNSPFLVQQAADFAGRLRTEAGDNLSAQVRLGFRLAFGREPTADEAEAAVGLVRTHGLPALCRALFNANEFLYVD